LTCTCAVLELLVDDARTGIVDAIHAVDAVGHAFVLK
jgi:hypothetical protein